MTDFCIELSSPFTGIGSPFRHWAACRCRNILFIRSFEQFEKIGDKWFFEEVTLQPSIDEEVHEAVCAEDGQVLGNVRLADVEGIFEIAHAFDAFIEFFKYLDADWVGNNSEEIDSLILWDHFAGISFWGELLYKYMQILEYLYSFVKHNLDGKLDDSYKIINYIGAES